METLGPINLIALVAVGAALLWTVRFVYGRRRTSDDGVKQCLLIGAWVMIAIGIAGAILGAASIFGLFLIPATIVVVLMAIGEYRKSERRALLFALAAAADKGIPLWQAADSFASDRDDGLGHRAALLAQALYRGRPLPAALAHTGHHLPMDALLAVRVGAESSRLGPALRQIANSADRGAATLKTAFEKLLYLVVMGNAAIAIVAFVMVKIVPVYARMFEEFELALPTPTLLLIEACDAAAAYWFIFAPLVMLLQLLLLLGLLHYLGWLPRDLPMLGWLARRLDGALVMRSLAVAVGQQRPLRDMVQFLADWFPRSSTRTRLRRAVTRIDQGVHWCASLCEVGLIGAADAAVLEAAQRAGNLRWALEEMADSAVRRLAHRTRALSSVLFPLATCAAAMIVAFIVISLFMPLIALTNGLT